MHCQIVLKLFSHTFHEYSFASFKLLTHTIQNHMTVTVQKWTIFTINPPLKSSEHDIHNRKIPMHCQIVLKFFSQTYHEYSFASFKLLTHTIPNHMTVTVQKWTIFTINPPLKSSEHDIHIRNIPMHCQIVLKFFSHTFHECSFASLKLLTHTIPNHMTVHRRLCCSGCIHKKGTTYKNYL